VEKEFATNLSTKLIKEQIMSKFKVGDKVTANYGTYVENGTVTKVIEITPSTSDYTVTFSDGETDIFGDDELSPQI
jgi:hypothetical protein